ncbi:MAG: reverse transcriptase domain-containing protein [Planctomycetota bacterium]
MNSRQEIYDRIRESSRDEVILEEMIRLGFWPDDRGVPESPAEEIRRKGELQRELNKLTRENRQLQNVEAIRREQRKQRLAESRQKRKENKERKLRERKERAEAWKRKQQSEITYLGDRYSAGLDDKAIDAERLRSNGLEHIGDIAGLAKAMGISVSLLRFLAFDRRTSTTTHYTRFGVKKKTGGVRTISAPMPRLKHAQRWILDHLLEPHELNECAHGFRRNRSIVTNAEPHVGSRVVINMDLENFFPTVDFPRVRGVFRRLGLSGSVATVLALICTESDVSEVELDGMEYYVARGERVLPQGAPTSPAITNLICRGLDARMADNARRLGFTYTRYADDLTFSSVDDKADVGKMIRRARYIVHEENFKVHPHKTRVLRAGRRLEVTGLTVNQKVSVSRKELRRFRAVLFQIERDGPQGKQWGSSSDVISAVEGYANFVAMVDAEKGKKFQAQVRRIIERYRPDAPDFIRRERWVEPTRVVQQSTEVPPEKPPASEDGRATQQADKAWWKFW